MNSAEESNRASALTGLLRAELRDARFSVARLAPTNIELVSGAIPTGTVSSSVADPADRAGFLLRSRPAGVRRRCRQCLSCPPMVNPL